MGEKRIEGKKEEKKEKGEGLSLISPVLRFTHKVTRFQDGRQLPPPPGIRVLQGWGGGGVTSAVTLATALHTDILSEDRAATSGAGRTCKN